jgi:cation diffusion facilitator family transporter
MHTAGETTSWNPFPPTEATEDAQHRAAANRAIGISALGLAVTGALELTVAVLSGSVGLLGDALHNLSDVSTSLVVFVGFRFSRRSATPDHTYGFDRAEDLAGLGVALAIWASAAFAGVVSVHKLTERGATSHLAIGMVAAGIGIVGNQVVARYKRKVGTRIHSMTLLADARHSWLDAIASGGALLGLIGVASGLRWADGVAGLLVTAFIVHVGYKVTSEVVGHLMDGVDPELVLQAETTALEVEGVEHVHVRARWSGRSLLFDIEGFIPATSTLDRAERVGREVERAVSAAIPESRAVLWSPHTLPAEP